MDCDHITHPEHWLGDCGDIDAVKATIEADNTTT